MSSSDSRIKRIVRDPALHFLMIGGLVFSLALALGKGAKPDHRGKQHSIRITREMIQALQSQAAKERGRAPSAAQLRQAVQELVDDEILYREALALGLDRGDLIIRRRLVQKMRFFAEDLGGIGEPTDAELMAYLDQHRARYERPARISLQQILFARSKWGDQAPARARHALERIAGLAPAQVKRKLEGDASSLPAVIQGAGLRQLESRFGRAFAQRSFDLPRGQWTGPVESVFGQHLIWVERNDPARPAALQEVRPQVRLALIEQRRQENSKKQLARMRQRHAVQIDWSADAGQTTATAKLAFGGARP
jgi:parvulin-like peptidyl-prolyl isomerase